MNAFCQYRPKDFVETREGLLFAVLAAENEVGRVFGCLRYRRTTTGLVKLTTLEANAILTHEFPGYLCHCASRDVLLPVIACSDIVQHFRPHDALRRSRDLRVTRAASLLGPLGEHVGITGSHLIGANTANSDIDLVIYGIDNFNLARSLLDAAMESKLAQPLSDSQWRSAFGRRQCTALSFQEYCWHERRKRNKVWLDGTQLDISCVAPTPCIAHSAGKKLGRMTLQARVTDERFAFTTPAVYHIDHPSVSSIVVHTATYFGQAHAGETVEAAGSLEQTRNFSRRLIVGASREAHGEYVKVIHTPDSVNC